MTATLKNLTLTLAQNHEQRLLPVVTVGYTYELTNTADPGIKDPATPFNVSIDVLGDDVLTDDLLAAAVDAHGIDCPPGNTVTGSRTLTVSQGLLDEDIGDDEIKLTVHAQRGADAAVEATAPVVKGKF